MKFSLFWKKMVGVVVFGGFFLCVHHVSAAPNLEVNISPQTVLLGGQAQYTVTVRNTDASDKAYNVGFQAVFDSNRIDPEGRVTFVSAQDETTPLIPSSVVTDANTGQTTIDFVNVRDLAQNETYTFTHGSNRDRQHLKYIRCIADCIETKEYIANHAGGTNDRDSGSTVSVCDRSAKQLFA